MPYSRGGAVKRLIVTAMLLAAMGGAMPAQAERRFMAELSRFAERDADVAHVGGALFLGSSSIRLWDLARGFPGAQAVNHGFGGATVADVLASYDLLVAGHQPETIIVYVGENDLASGRPAAEVAADVGTLLGRLRQDFPQARIAYLSIKYAPVRWAMHDQVAQANRLIGAQAADGGFDFIDVTASLVAADKPDARLFGTDGLHLSDAGYGRWNRIVAPYLAAGDPSGDQGGKGSGGKLAARGK